VPSSEWTRDGVDAAREARVRFGVGLDAPLPDIVTLIEELAEVPVVLCVLPNGVAGAYLFKGGSPFIFANGRHAPVRQRFTLAHELGHHVMNHRTVVDTGKVMDDQKDPREVMANSFAAEFLAPVQAVSNWMEARNNPQIDTELVTRIAAYFGISAQAASYRLDRARYFPARRDWSGIDDAISRARHLEIARSMDLPELHDVVYETHTTGRLPRLPQTMVNDMLAGYAAGLVSLERIADATGRSTDAVVRRLSELGISAPQDEQQTDWWE